MDDPTQHTTIIHARLAPQIRWQERFYSFENGVSLGPLIDKAALDKVEEHVADAISKCDRIITGGRRHDLGGTFYEATIILGVTNEMAVAREETFGPVAPLFRFKDEQDVIG